MKVHVFGTDRHTRHGLDCMVPSAAEERFFSSGFDLRLGGSDVQVQGLGPGRPTVSTMNNRPGGSASPLERLLLAPGDR